MKRDKGSTKRQQERKIFTGDSAEGIGEFAEFATAQDDAPISGIPSENPGAANIGADHTAKSLEEHLTVYTREQSCIEKLALACFCLKVPLRKTLAAVALLLSKSISPANIAEVAAILDHKLGTYRRRFSQNRRKRESRRGGSHRRAPTVVKKLGGSHFQRQPARRERAPDIKRPKVYPNTIFALEKGLDDLLILLRAMDAARWNLLTVAGLLNERSRQNVMSKKPTS